MNRSQNNCCRSLLAISIALGVNSCLIPPIANAAEEVSLVSGAFRRSISVSDLEYLAESGIARGLLKDALKFSKQKPKDVSKLLNQKVKLPISLISRLMDTRIGNVIISRVSKIIYPLKVLESSVSIPALRAGVINGLQIGKGNLDAISFLKAYPSESMAINLPALFGIMEKAESVSELVKFFADSPLENLHNTKP